MFLFYFIIIVCGDPEWRRMGEWMYSSTHWPRHQMEMSGQLHAPATLPPGKESLIPSGQRLGGPQSRSGRGGEEKIYI
jgi:hypothetical protein